MTEPGRRPSEAVAEAIAAIEDDRAGWSWQSWGQPLLSTDRGRWALDVLSGDHRRCTRGGGGDQRRPQ